MVTEVFDCSARESLKDKQEGSLVDVGVEPLVAHPQMCLGQLEEVSQTSAEFLQKVSVLGS